MAGALREPLCCAAGVLNGDATSANSRLLGLSGVDQLGHAVSRLDLDHDPVPVSEAAAA
jgi:hypothetical protein